MLFKKLYLLITLTTFSLIFINDDVLNKNNTMAQIKTSSIYVKVKGENNNYLSFKNIPKLSFECAKPNCKCLKQFDINDIDKEYFNNKISIEDNRDEKENNGYNLSLTLGDFFHLDNNGQIQEKVDGIKNSFSLKMGDLKLENHISRNISQKNMKQNNKSMIFTNGSVIPGNYVGNLNWTLSPSLHNVNDSL